jgi:TPR repeat protein
LTALQYAADQGTGGAMEARPHVCRRRRRAAGRPARLQLFQRDRQYPSGRDAGHAAGALRRQRLRGARALLSHRHSQFEDRRIRRARARCSLCRATYFGDADAQYELGRLYLDGTPSDPHQAARWFQLAATKGHCRAEGVLGDMLFQGQPCRGRPRAA